MTQRKIFGHGAFNATDGAKVWDRMAGHCCWPNRPGDPTRCEHSGNYSHISARIDRNLGPIYQLEMAGAVAWNQRAWEEVDVAKKLRATGNRVQAYHHAGQAVEFALKAIYMRKKGLSAWPDENKGAKWHSLPHIAACASLDQDLAALKANRNGYENWLVVRDWDSNGRFPGNTPSVKEINDLILAVCHDRDGVMTWLDDIYQNL